MILDIIIQLRDDKRECAETAHAISNKVFHQLNGKLDGMEIDGMNYKLVRKDK